MTALATWKRGRQDNEVEVLSRPDATGMVDVIMLWSQQRTRAHRAALEPKNDTASRLLEMAEKFVILPGPAKSAIRPEPALIKPKAVRLPGERIERTQAVALFGSNALLGIQTDARLRLLGKADGSVVLRAYDADGLICERAYQCQPNEQQTAAVAKKAKGTVKPKVVAPLPGPSNAEVKDYVHPDFGIALREVAPTAKLAAYCGSVGAARAAIYHARKDEEPTPEGWAFTMTIKTPHGLTKVYVAAVRKTRLDGQEYKEVRVFLDADDRLELVEALQGTAYTFSLGAL